ncbi:MAG: ArgR family transcriptional regulator [Alloprevotella sp.]|nr:ArgR family transcriptional regulator [Alloprevotella sp.]MBR1387974.1 ArgR family transcriptional regulator [Alloprevotella sp.]
MKKREQRLDAIRTLLQAMPISNQAELAEALKRNGYVVSQPTLSADLKRLGVAKVRTQKGDRYKVREGQGYQRVIEKKLAFEYLENSAVQTIEFANHVAVIKTRPGFAAGIAIEIDRKHLQSVLGTIAGFDTVLVVCSNEVAPDILRAELMQIMPAFDSLLNHQ